ncbi:SagB family peptide dehydrogenase [Actinokineospora guangxiensis]|uniref:SagB family peptide dehydrogenase n=1 Tax=Actinokineospora guangxiensis TaxID=1490288 RepID=A0ABW0ERY3_9PSEU
MSGWTREFALIHGVFLVASETGPRSLARAGGAIELPAFGGREDAVVRALGGGFVSEAHLCALVAADERTALRHLVTKLHREGWSRVRVSRGGAPAYSVEPYPAAADDNRGAPVPRSAQLSRHAHLRRDGDDLVVESPRARARLRLHDPALVAAITRPVDPPGRDAPPWMTADLVSAGLADHADGADGADGAELSPHEEWFHARSHLGAPTTTTPPPLRRAPMGRPVPLPVPAPVPEWGLSTALNQRRSVREHDDDHPITAAALIALLSHAVGVREEFAVDGVDLARRPYPSGGALHELEFFPVVGRAADLAPGAYRFDPFGPGLEAVAPEGAAQRRVLRAAATAMGAPRPQVLLVCTARVDRIAWRYPDLAYSLVLRHVGAAQQTLYLVATAMGLAPCALGGGDRRAFAELTGTDPLREPAVGEFAIGSRKGATWGC